MIDYLLFLSLSFVSFPRKRESIFQIAQIFFKILRVLKMNSRFRRYSLISSCSITVLLLFFPIHSTYAASSPQQNPYVHKKLCLPCFKSIQASGDIDFQIDTSAYRQMVEVSGRLKNVQAVSMEVKGKTLYIGMLAQGQKRCRTKVRICAPWLTGVSYGGGSGNIWIRQRYRSCPLCLSVYGSPNVKIDGSVRLCQLVAGEDAKIWMYWVNSIDCYVKAMDGARVCLAGVANTLEVNSFGRAWINTRYLRARRAFIKSYDNSRVDVSAICSLNALASQHSGIYYYQDPRFQAPYMQCAGSVVDMTKIYYPCCDLCDRACCKNSWH